MKTFLLSAMLSAAILSAAITSVPASAEHLLGPSVTVAVHDLDLRTEAGRASLLARVNGAIETVCPAPEISLYGKLERSHCIRDTAARARRAMDVAIARAASDTASETLAAR